MEELKHLLTYYEKVTGESANVVGLALSSRKNLCINTKVSARLPRRVAAAVDHMFLLDHVAM